MKTIVEAIFEDGVFKPVLPPELPEGQRVQITVESASPYSSEDVLRIAGRVYHGLSPSDIEEIEEMARRRVFFTREPI
ncbi:MAG TPA: antitoxin family protein [Vicinamibacteria bacterium]|nr:antitoxin family protein [Vicinamibacteria bacterium]